MPRFLLLAATLFFAVSCASSPPTTIPLKTAPSDPVTAESTPALQSPSLPPSASAPAAQVPSDAITWVAYHPDPDHLWNRLFRHLFRRTDADRQEFGLDPLDPLLWYETRHLLEGSSYEKAVQLLDEFLSAREEALVSDPLKRAMLQRDLWAVFDWLAFRTVDYPREREALQQRLAQVIRRLALTQQEIRSLPSNYQAAVTSRAFPSEYQIEDPEKAFLPD